MEDCISKESLKKWQVYSIERKEYVVPVNIINIMQPLDVRPLIYGIWIKLYDKNYKCSNCNSWWSMEQTPEESGLDYCPSCGADMRGKNENICN